MGVKDSTCHFLNYSIQVGEPSARARFVYPTAVHLMTNLGHSWEEALRTAGDLWRDQGLGIVGEGGNEGWAVL